MSVHLNFFFFLTCITFVVLFLKSKPQFFLSNILLSWIYFISDDQENIAYYPRNNINGANGIDGAQSSCDKRFSFPPFNLNIRIPSSPISSSVVMEIGAFTRQVLLIIKKTIKCYIHQYPSSKKNR